MTIEEFWNRAFLASLTRLQADEAKEEADKALQLCIDKWQGNNMNWALYPPLWQKQDVAHVPKLRDD